jgi:thioesterase domain-containing protein
VVLARDEASGRRLVGYVVARPGMQADPATLRQHLSERLPGYMVPAVIVRLEAWPLTTNQKIDRRALPAPPAVASQGAAPEGPVETALSAVWAEVLGHAPQSCDDDFFALGGQSLTAIRLCSEIERRFGVVLPLARVFAQRTLGAMAALLGGAPLKDEEPTVIPLRATGTRVPLFCICGIQLYQRLADSLDADQPVYGVYLPSEQGMFEAEAQGGATASVEQLAAEYVVAVRRQQPQGPYRLAGISFGGVLALEMAQQLRRAGAEVELVVLLDSLLPGATAARDVGQRLAAQLRSLRSDGLRRFTGRLVDKLGRRVHRSLGRVSPPAPEVPPAEAELAARRGAAYMRLSLAYERVIPPYAGDVLLFRAQDRTWHGRVDLDASNGWQRHVTGPLYVHDIPGDHLGIIAPPNVRILAELLQARLDRGLEAAHLAA